MPINSMISSIIANSEKLLLCSDFLLRVTELLKTSVERTFVCWFFGALFFWGFQVGFGFFSFPFISLILICWMWNKCNRSHKIIPCKYLGGRKSTGEAQVMFSVPEFSPWNMHSGPKCGLLTPFTKKPCNSVWPVSKTGTLTTLYQINMPQIYMQYLRNFRLLLNWYKSTDEFNRWSYLLTLISDYPYATRC